MEKAVVYFTDFRCPVGTSLTDKLRRLCIAAGMKNMDLTGKFVAIKMHFGELGNLAFLRPNYAKVVVDLCKEMGGLPFLTDDYSVSDEQKEGLRAIRKVLASTTNGEAVVQLIDMMQKTHCNADLLNRLQDWITLWEKSGFLKH